MSEQTARAYGGDLSLRHGSVVYAEMRGDTVQYVTSIYKWDKKDSHSLGLKSPPDDIQRKVEEITRAMNHDPARGNAITFSIDWAPQAVYWRTNKALAVQMGMFMGMLYLSSNWKSSKDFLEFVPPYELRSYFSLASNAAKLLVQETALMVYPPPPNFLNWANEDDIDAYILAIYSFPL